MLCDLLDANLVWMPSVSYITKLCLFVFVPLLLNGIGNLLAYVAALFVTSVCRWLSVRG